MTLSAELPASFAGGLEISGRTPSVPFPLEELAAAYDRGAWRSLLFLPRGKNEHVLVTTDRTRFFLRRSHRFKTFDSLEWQVDLLARLRRDGLPVPVPLPSHGGEQIVVAEERLFLATGRLPGFAYDPTRSGQLRAAGRMLGAYHATVAGYAVPAPDPTRQDPLEGVRDLLARVSPAALPEVHAVAEEFAEALDALWADLPVTTVHGGFRRGSLLFDGPGATGLLDLDSARSGPRCLDLAIALHDFGKVYTSPEADDHKVALDFDRAAEFLRGYRQMCSLTAAEAEAVPVLIASRRAKRALGRTLRMAAGEPMSPNDLLKIELEQHRVAWLRENRARLHRICAG